MLLVPAWLGVAETANQTAERGEPALVWVHCAAGMLLLSGLSDVLDGRLARRYGLQSRLGAILDAVADKLTQVVLTTYLALRVGPAFDVIPLWFLLLLVARDALLLVGLLVVTKQRRWVTTEHEWHGRAVTVVLFLALLAFLWRAPQGMSGALLVAGGLLVAYSTLAYVLRAANELRALSRG